ncbi:hypothetical protein OIU77_026769 [Salix suchowensis]|uniref:Leucine-rich repeat-containing N-terminal plant-type domain-containing protein n=1 Tax=Salix suchowensis TaxID=1278906 RepID=A0ABQ9BMM1_9ROSI|nr:hypothetical protein OIU77_026769 [Salix suchowensis]
MASSGDCDAEGDALPARKANSTDPSSLLQSWAPTPPVNPCTRVHVTCNTDNSVVRVYVPSFRARLFFSELGLSHQSPVFNLHQSSDGFVSSMRVTVRCQPAISSSQSSPVLFFKIK